MLADVRVSLDHRRRRSLNEGDGLLWVCVCVALYAPMDNVSLEIYGVEFVSNCAPSTEFCAIYGIRQTCELTSQGNINVTGVTPFSRNTLSNETEASHFIINTYSLHI